MLVASRSFRSFRCARILARQLTSNSIVFKDIAPTPRNTRYPSRTKEQTTEGYVSTVRDKWGDNLPGGLLSPQEYEVYERNYGPPVRILEPDEVIDTDEYELGEYELDASGTVTLENADGVVKGQMGEDEPQEFEPGKIRTRTEKEAKMYARIGQDIQQSLDLADKYVESHDGELDVGDRFENVEDPTMRTHPLTMLGRFGTHPATIVLPGSIAQPTSALLSDVSNKHLDDAASKTLGGERLPLSPLMTWRTEKAYTGMPLDASHGMTDMQANVYLATVLPGFYAQTLSVLTELRRRLGRGWVLGRDNSTEPGVKRVLDVGTGGAGVLAWYAMLEAEQKLRADEVADLDGPQPASAESKPTEGAIASDDLRAVVVVGSDSLRVRMSKFLENTMFIPRVPDVTTGSDTVSSEASETAPKQPRKLYDLIIATNTIIPIFEAHKRNSQVQNFWSLLNPKGGVLILIEKGSPYGFEAIAGAREHLLKHNISTPGSESRPLTYTEDISDPKTPKEVASIIAPCTNHATCPMFVSGPGKSMRHDYCSFPQRYERPGYMQRVLKARGVNHEDLRYSYLAVRRGIDVTRQGSDAINPQITDFDTVTTPPHSPYSMAQLRSYAFTLPRMVFPPIKRHGHVTIDLCTAKGAIERWTIPRSFGKVAFRDARKSQWGDLWALGAKTKILRNLNMGTKLPSVRKKVERTVDFVKGEVKEVEKKADLPGGKKKNPGKRERERRIARREAQKSRSLERGVSTGKLV